jgi:peptide deformylase
MDIVQVGDPVLRRPAARVSQKLLKTPFVQQLITSMIDTMRSAGGVGLAAPQVGEALQLFVMADDDEERLSKLSDARRAEQGRQILPLHVLVNPVLDPDGEETDEFFEGCLSLSGYSGLVRRFRRVRITGLDSVGERVQLALDGWPARIAQHECDHLAGRLYIDVMDPLTLTTAANLDRYWKARPAAEIRRILGCS